MNIFKYSYQMLIICTLLYGFQKYSYLIIFNRFISPKEKTKTKSNTDMDNVFREEGRMRYGSSSRGLPGVNIHSRNFIVWKTVGDWLSKYIDPLRVLYLWPFVRLMLSLVNINFESEKIFRQVSQYIRWMSIFLNWHIFIWALGIPSGVVANVMDCKIIVSKFELQSRYYVSFQVHNFGKSWKTSILQTIS